MLDISIKDIYTALIFVFLSLNLFGDEDISIYISIKSLSPDTEEILEESYMLIASAMSSAGFKTIVKKESDNLDSLISDGLGAGVPVVMYSLIEISDDAFKVNSSLVHCANGEIIEQVQSQTSISLGMQRRWDFITSRFIQALNIYPVSFPIISESVAPEKTVVDIAEENTEPEDALIDMRNVPPLKSDSPSIEKSKPFFLRSMDSEAQFLLPLGPLGKYSDWGLGGAISLDGRFNSIPFNLSFTMGGTYESSPNPYIDILIHLSVFLEVSYSFTLAGNHLELTPGIGFGGLFQLVEGNFNTISNINTAFFIDQYYNLFAEMTYYPAGSGGRWGVYLKPGFYFFPAKEQVGMKTGFSVGAKYRFSKGGTQ